MTTTTAAIVITDPANPIVQAIFLKGHAKLMQAGMRHSTLTPTSVKRKITAITAVNYPQGKRGWEAAIADLQKIIDTGKVEAPK